VNKRARGLLYWTPRVLGILFAAFLSLFALDVFDADYGLGETLIALIMHLVPTFVLLLAVIIGWRWEWIGGLLFQGFSIFYVVIAWGQFPFVNYLAISGPLFLVGSLFLLNWRYRDELRSQIGEES
jgi:hypothetical protein